MAIIGIDDAKKAEWDAIFGPDSHGGDEASRAKTSRQEFVRSQDHLAFFSEGATGRRLSAWEAYDTFGMDCLREAHEYGSAVLVSASDEPGISLRHQREYLGFPTVEAFSRLCGLPAADIQQAESAQSRTPIRFLERLARTLGLDERIVTFRPGAERDEQFAYRLREMAFLRGRDGARLPESALLDFTEAAWVIGRQHRLMEWLEREPLSAKLKTLGFGNDSRYGDKGYPAWRFGYDLARTTRNKLDLPPDQPVILRSLVEERLGIPLVQMELPSVLAGATVARGEDRGIVVNVEGLNTNPWVRRSTIAHELGHLLWDPSQKLKSLTIDEFDALEEAPWTRKDYVEARANAFAIEFLAPQQAVLDMYNEGGRGPSAVRRIMEYFGVSFTAARYQIWNALDRSIAIETIVVDSVDCTDEWRGSEDFTLDYFPIPQVPYSRRGVFFTLVEEAASNGLISNDSAAEYLGCSEKDFLAKRDAILSLSRS